MVLGLAVVGIVVAAGIAVGTNERTGSTEPAPLAQVSPDRSTDTT
jgi:hypothetical protein